MWKSSLEREGRESRKALVPFSAFSAIQDMKFLTQLERMGSLLDPDWPDWPGMRLSYSVAEDWSEQQPGVGSSCQSPPALLSVSEPVL